ncbi:hypothetical protein LJC07_08650, partial [Christensenellaceae bacterium OttesenSCG-928-L17]|nr:hypothetical protein [Christensenellaceae bacterium OttesenSCG-928-L17]
MPQEVWETLTKATEGFIWAKPKDVVSMESTAKAGHIEGYTTSYAKVTNSLMNAENPEVKTSSSGKKVEISRERTVVAADTGKIFTATAHANPIFASLTWIPDEEEYTMGYKKHTRPCQYMVDCSEWRMRDGQMVWVEKDCPRTCNYIDNWVEVPGTYVKDWIEHTETSGEITKSVSIYIPYNYEIELPSIEPCVEVPPYQCSDGWPKLDVTSPGEDREFAHSVKIVPKQNDNLGQTYATNSRPTTYEIISFVTTPESNAPNGQGVSSNVISGIPGSGTSCSHYTSGTSLARGCVVVQREENIFFNTLGGVELEGKTDNASYDVNGNFSKSLAPSVVIDDLPAGSKFCVAISVWPAGSNDQNSSGLDKDSQGGHWKYSDPKCLTIAKKPTTEFWGAGIFSQGDITTSQSVKYVPNAGGFIASGNENSPTNGLSYNDAARRVFGSWSEYEVIGNSSVKGIGSGASLGYQGVSGQGFLSRPGGYPASFPASRTFASDNICYYSSQTFRNAIGAECKASMAQGNANINTNTDLTIGRIISRYATDTSRACTDTSHITINSTSVCSTSSDGVLQNYTSSSKNVTLSASGVVPKGKTVTVTVPGKLTITSDIIYENINYSNISDLPQVILIADSIDVAPQVSRIDAWLVVGQNSSS